MIKIDKTDTAIYAGFFCIAFFVCLKSCLNPFGLMKIDPDTSVYLIITRGIIQGQVPFRDFYDNKGPLMYLFSVPGFAWGHFTGVWITELIFMCISIFFAYKTALFFGSRAFAFIGVAISFIIFQTFYLVSAGTEGYSLPFMMLSFYIFTKHYFSQKNVLPLEIVILGFCFAVSVLIRVNFFPLWLGFCTVICIETIKRRDFTGLGKYIILFCIGIAVVTIPVILYLKTNNALSDYINQNFITGGSRGLSSFSFIDFTYSFFIITGKNLCFTPLLIGYMWIIKDHTSKKTGCYIGYLLAFILTVAFHAVIGTSYDHYNMVLTPFLVPAFTFFVGFIYKYFSNIKYSKLCFAVFMFLFIPFSYPLIKNVFLLSEWAADRSRTNEILTGKTIDEYTTKDDKIIFLDWPCRIYLFTQRDAASRYIYQATGVDYEPEARNEFLNDILGNNPEIIVMENREGRYDYLPDWYAPIYDLIENKYSMITSENGYFLFKLKEK